MEIICNQVYLEFFKKKNKKDVKSQSMIVIRLHSLFIQLRNYRRISPLSLPAPPIELSDIDPLVEYVEFLLDLEFTSHAF